MSKKVTPKTTTSKQTTPPKPKIGWTERDYERIGARKPISQPMNITQNARKVIYIDSNGKPIPIPSLTKTGVSNSI